MKNKNFRQRLLLTVLMLMCIVTIQMNAQDSEEKALKTAEQKVKLADKNPKNGKMQYEASMALIDNELGEKKDYDRALAYANRALKIARENPAPKDTLLGLSYMGIGLIYINTDRYENAIDYLEMAIDAFEVELGRDDPLTNNSKIVYGGFMIGAQPYRGLAKIMEAMTDNSLAPKNKRVENMDEANIALEMAFEMVLARMNEQFRYALPMIFIEGEKHFVVQTKDWNMERPLVGWLTAELMRTKEENDAFQGDETIISDNSGNLRIMPKEEKDKHQLTFQFKSIIRNPRRLEYNEGDSRIWFLNPDAYNALLNKYREFKAANKK